MGAQIPKVNPHRFRNENFFQLDLAQESFDHPKTRLWLMPAPRAPALDLRKLCTSFPIWLRTLQVLKNIIVTQEDGMAQNHIATQPLLV